MLVSKYIYTLDYIQHTIMSQIDELIAIIKTLGKDVASLNKEVASLRKEVSDMHESNDKAAESAEAVFRALSSKIDNQHNLSVESAAAISQAQATAAPSRTAKLTPSVFFKKLVSGNIDAYIDKLYTKEDIDAIAADESVAKCKTEAQRNTRVIALLYTKCVKTNKDYAKALNDIIAEQS